MAHLLDTGILLRLADERDPLHPVVDSAVESLIAQREELLIGTQNVAEFWNVATRPLAANGLELPASAVLTLLETVIEPVCSVLVETDEIYHEFKRLGKKYEFRGKQAHDARLVALMRCWGIDKILTLNDRDFLRYEAEGIVAVNPRSLGRSS